MAVEFDGGVVIGADSRTSTGSYVANRVSNKLTFVHDRIFCCRSGSAADTQAISDAVKANLEWHAVELGRLPAVKTAATLFQRYCYERKDQISAGIICAGWDETEGGCVYSIPLGGTLVREPCSIGGSGSSYVYGYVDAHYRRGMTKEECLQFVKTTLSHAMSRDGSSGGVIRTVTITKDSVIRDYTPGDRLPYMD